MASSATHRHWASSEPSDGRVLKREAQTLDEVFLNRHDSKDLLLMSAQSTPVLGSFHESPVPPATPKNSSKTALHDKHSLARAETLATATTHKQQAQTTPWRYRPTHGHVTIKTRTSQQTGFAGLLCIERGFISVVGGAELDDTILSIPLPFAELKVVPGHDNVLELQVKTPDAKPNGIFVVVSDCSARDRWLEAFSAVGVKINYVEARGVNTAAGDH